MPSVIRLADGDDAAPAQEIYAPIVRDTAISFELDVPDMGEMRRRIATTLEGLPWIVCESGEGVLGYAYAGTHRTRAAYQWAVNVHRSLFGLLTLRGFRNAFAGITLPNPASVGLHESLDFKSMGVYRKVG